MNWAIISTTSQYIVFIKSQSIYNGIMVIDCAKLISLWLFPNPDFVWASRGKSVFNVVIDKWSYSFFMLGEGLSAWSIPNVPKSYHLVMRACYNLRLVNLADNVFNSISMAT